ncbi:hypothetical protein J6590_009104 [Homalodisca vitripennis]|nr:hypothetical protein J6590_009104 [Homalodisca vitripennis]
MSPGGSGPGHSVAVRGRDYEEEKICDGMAYKLSEAKPTRFEIKEYEKSAGQVTNATLALKHFPAILVCLRSKLSLFSFIVCEPFFRH